jgi:hypothetical protein
MVFGDPGCPELQQQHARLYLNLRADIYHHRFDAVGMHTPLMGSAQTATSCASSACSSRFRPTRQRRLFLFLPSREESPPERLCMERMDNHYRRLELALRLLRVHGLGSMQERQVIIQWHHLRANTLRSRTRETPGGGSAPLKTITAFVCRRQIRTRKIHETLEGGHQLQTRAAVRRRCHTTSTRPTNRTNSSEAARAGRLFRQLLRAPTQ